MERKDQSKMVKGNKRGFTLGEMTITVAIIGTISAIAVPNFMRVKMQVNMEMVRQHLKTIGTHMNDLYNRNRQFPQDINQLGNSGEEVSITASLFGIDRKEYTTNQYTPGANLSTYQFRTCPKAGRWGIAGDRCFILDPMGITEDPVGGGQPVNAALAPWDGTDVPMKSPRISTMTLTYASGQLVSGYAINMEVLFYMASYMENFRTKNDLNGTAVTFAAFETPGPAVDQFKAMLPQIYDALKAKGIYLSVKEQDANSLNSNISPNRMTSFLLGYRLDKPLTQSALQTRLLALESQGVPLPYYLSDLAHSSGK